mmetsp:Transcript_3932/g.5845  ORF Transcript_3932/g.5845 Transcript_3932/m.5845 type:complete len:128 (-) Transcript_3932:45-428(-)
MLLRSLSSSFLVAPSKFPGLAPGFAVLNRAFSAKPRSFFALRYTFVDGMEEKRAPVRADHLNLIQEGVSTGDIVLAGALIKPIDQGLLIFESKSAAESFAKSDPYVTNGLVPKWDVREWMVVDGTKL